MAYLPSILAHYDNMLQCAKSLRLKGICDNTTLCAELMTNNKHGDLPKWLNALSQLPAIENKNIEASPYSCVTIKTQPVIDHTTTQKCKTLLQSLSPWRKGPFNLFGIYIDAEWQCNMKWDRIASHIDLQDKSVMDVGAGNGYYSYRMLEAGAQAVFAVEPTLRYVMQFHAIAHYTSHLPVYMLPLRAEELNSPDNSVDTVFSMGVFYHHREPEKHMHTLLRWAKPNTGQIIVETIVVDIEEANHPEGLRPSNRYAGMRNVRLIPTIDYLLSLFKSLGCRNIECIDISPTSIQEQRTTDWMTGRSLLDVLDAQQMKTVEGYAPPKRAIFTMHTPAK